MGEPVTSGGEQVRRALDAVLGQRQRLGEGARQHRLAGTWHVLKQDVAFRQDGHQHHPDHVILALDHLPDVGDDGLKLLLEHFLAQTRRRDGNSFHTLGPPLHFRLDISCNRRPTAPDRAITSSAAPVYERTTSG